MAVSANTVWEVRSTATGTAMQNGGGFVTGASGTDYSQQDGAQYALTGCTSAGAGNIVLTASAAADMVGNVCYVVSGTNFTSGATVGRFEITSVSVGVSFTCGTNQAGTAITTGVGANGVINIGGALSNLEDSHLEACTAGNTVYVKGGTAITYTPGAAINVSLVGGAQLPTKIIGYASTRGDVPTGATRPTISTGANRFILPANWNVSNIIHTCAINNGFTLGTNAVIDSCKIQNLATSAGQIAVVMTNDQFYVNCEVISNRGIGFNMSGSTTGTVVMSSWIHGCDIGAQGAAAGSAHTFINCIFSDCVTYGYSATTGATVAVYFDQCTFVGMNKVVGTAIRLATGTTDVRIRNSVISKWVTGVTHADATQTVGYDNYNCYYDNTTDVTNWIKGANDVTSNPTYSGITYITAGTATTANSPNTLTKVGANFVTNGVTAGRDMVYLTGGSSTAGMYGILSVDSETQLTFDLAPGASAGDVTYYIQVGQNYIPTNSTVIAGGQPGSFPGGFTVGVQSIGAAQPTGVQAGGGSGGATRHLGPIKF